MKKWLCAIIPVFLLGSLIAWRIEQKQTEISDQQQQHSAKKNAPATVSLANVEVKDLNHYYEVTGSVEAPLSVKIAPKITGRIEMLNVREGDRVKKGQVLVKIDSSQVEANVQQAMASVAEAQYKLAQAQMTQNPTDVSVNTQIRQEMSSVFSAKADLDQVKKNYTAKLASAQADVSEATANIENANAGINSAKANLNNAQAKYNRYKSLSDKGFVSSQDFDDVKAELEVQKSALKIADAQLNSAKAKKDSSLQQYNIAKETGKSDIAASSAKLTQAKASLEYAKANTSSKSAYRQSIAALKATVAAAQASLKSAIAQRQDTVLISPLDGYVTGRYADPGAIASPTSPVISVQFVKQVWVSFPVPEDVCSKIHIGQPTKISFDTYPNKTFTASIIQVNPSADPESRQFTVRAIMSNTNNMFKPGMFAHVAIETDHVKNAVVVPREAVQKDKIGSYVMAAGKNRKAMRIPVVPEGEDNNSICIGDALKPGAKVVVMSASPIKEGKMLSTGKHKRGGSNKYGAGAR